MLWIIKRSLFICLFFHKDIQWFLIRKQSWRLLYDSIMKMWLENKLFFSQIELLLFSSSTIVNSSHQTHQTVALGLLQSILKAISYWFQSGKYHDISRKNDWGCETIHKYASNFFLTYNYKVATISSAYCEIVNKIIRKIFETLSYQRFWASNSQKTRKKSLKPLILHDSLLFVFEFWLENCLRD